MSSSWESKGRKTINNYKIQKHSFRASVYGSRSKIQNKRKLKVKLSLTKRRTKIINYAHTIKNWYQKLSLLTQMLMAILKSVYMNKEKVNIRFHSTALIAYMTFSENSTGLYQTVMHLMMKMFNLEVVRNTFLFIYNIIFSLFLVN